MIDPLPAKSFVNRLTINKDNSYRHKLSDSMLLTTWIWYQGGGKLPAAESLALNRIKGKLSEGPRGLRLIK